MRLQKSKVVKSSKSHFGTKLPLCGYTERALLGDFLMTSINRNQNSFWSYGTNGLKDLQHCESIIIGHGLLGCVTVMLKLMAVFKCKTFTITDVFLYGNIHVILLRRVTVDMFEWMIVNQIFTFIPSSVSF